MSSKRILVCLTGASGSIYGVGLVKALKKSNVEVHLIISKWGSETLEHETGMNSEICTPDGCNCSYSNHASVPGPIRVGGYTTASDSREDAGASYYDVQELSSNLCEQIVTVGNSGGRAFLGTHGDGTLENASGYEGYATNSDWPGYTAGQGVSGATGMGFRGGSWFYATTFMEISDRIYAGTTWTPVNANVGGRCARTAP